MISQNRPNFHHKIDQYLHSIFRKGQFVQLFYRSNSKTVDTLFPNGYYFKEFEFIKKILLHLIVDFKLIFFNILEKRTLKKYSTLIY